MNIELRMVSFERFPLIIFEIFSILPTLRSRSLMHVGLYH